MSSAAERSGAAAGCRGSAPEGFCSSAACLLAVPGDALASSLRLTPLPLPPSAGHVPVESVNSYRRSFGRLEPHGKRWWHYDSLKQLVDAAEWADVQEWLLCK